MLKQTTIKHPISCYGIGAHSGRTVQLILKPAKANTGIVFIRSDVTAYSNIIPALYSNVTDTILSTTISNEHKVAVSTIEHLMAAIWGSGVDNLIIELDGAEVPIMDGSSQPFIFMLECAGVQTLSVPKKFLKINKEVSINNGKGGEIFLQPAEEFQIDLAIEFTSKAIGYQKTSFNNNSSFTEEVAGARTFGFIEELEFLRSNGLAKGSSLENAIGIDKDVILNKEGLRFNDEFVRHKLLDAIGDFSTASSSRIIGHFTCFKTGHALNNMLLQKLFSDNTNYSWVSIKDLL